MNFAKTPFVQNITLKEGIHDEEYKAYPLSIPALRFFSSLTIEKKVLVLSGEASCGKSTILKAISSSACEMHASLLEKYLDIEIDSHDLDGVYFLSKDTSLSFRDGIFRDNCLYLLDEPESYLSPRQQLSLLISIEKAVKRGVQFIISSHSPIILGYKDAQIVSMDEGMASVDYKNTDSYKVFSCFMEDPIKYQRILFDESPLNLRRV